MPNATTLATIFLAGMLSVTGMSSAFATIDDNLVAYFGFDGNTLDYSGNQNNGNVTGSEQYRSGTMGSAFNFDGTSYITLANESNFDFDDDFSIAFWYKPTEESKGLSDVIIGKGNTIGTDAGIYVAHGTGGNAQFQIRTDTTYNLISDSTMSANDWVHVVASHSGNNNTSGMTIYVNGTSDVTNSSTTMSGSALNADALVVGAETDGTKKSIGNIDDVRIYDVELTSTQVQSIYEESPFVLITDNEDAITINEDNITTNMNSVTTLQTQITSVNGTTQVNEDDITTNENTITSLQTQITSVNGTLNTLDAKVTVIDTLVDYINTFLDGLFANY